MVKEALDDLSMKPTRDDMLSRQQKGKRKRSSQAVVKDKLPTQSPSASGRRTLVLFLLLMIVAAGAGGWVLWQQIVAVRQQLSASQQQLAQSQRELAVLNKSMNSQSSALDLTGDNLKQTLSTQAGEIRKLVAQTASQMQADIRKNTQAVAGVNKQLKQLQKMQKTGEKSQSEQGKQLQLAITDLKEQIQQEALQGSLTSTQLNELEGQLTALQKVVNNQKKQLTKLKSVSKNKTAVNELSQRLDAIDTYRRQVNGRLDKLERDLNKLYR